MKEKYEPKLVAKGYNQREHNDYKEKFFLVTTKDSFRVVMALVAQLDLDLHQMDVKMAFLNGNLYDNVYMVQPSGFVEKGKEHLVCKLRRSIYLWVKASL